MSEQWNILLLIVYIFFKYCLYQNILNLIDDSTVCFQEDCSSMCSRIRGNSAVSLRWRTSHLDRVNTPLRLTWDISSSPVLRSTSERIRFSPVSPSSYHVSQYTFCQSRPPSSLALQYALPQSGPPSSLALQYAFPQSGPPYSYVLQYAFPQSPPPSSLVLQYAFLQSRPPSSLALQYAFP